MDKIGEIFQSYVNLDQKSLIEIAAESIPKFLPVLKQVDAEHGGNVCLAMMISCAFGADGKLTEKESAFLRAVKLDVDLIKTILNTDGAYTIIDNLVDSMNTEEKAAALSFMICLCAIDESISPEENAFLRRLLAD